MAGTAVDLVVSMVTLILLVVPGNFEESLGPTISRQSRNEGLHKELQTDISIPLPEELLVDNCDILLVEHLPSAVYVDTFEIQQRVEFGGPKVMTDQVVNIEQPEYMSLPLKVLVFQPIRQKGQRLTTSVTLPVHLRYHQPQGGGGYVQVNQPHPQVYIRCPDTNTFSSNSAEKFPCSPDNSEEKCAWSKIDYTSHSPELEFSVPVGNSDFTFLISVLTLGTTVVGCLYVIVQSVFSCHAWPKDEKEKKR